MFNYDKNDFRDIYNINKFPTSCDIYSLGVLLKRLIELYYANLDKYNNVDEIKKETTNIMK